MDTILRPAAKPALSPDARRADDATGVSRAQSSFCCLSQSGGSATALLDRALRWDAMRQRLVLPA